MTEPKQHPGWKNAVMEIVNRFHREGYGIVVERDALLKMMSLDHKKKEVMTYDDYRKFEIEVMDFTTHLKKELLEEYNLDFDNVYGKGYTILHPNDQVDGALQGYSKGFVKTHYKAGRRLKHIQEDMLSSTAKRKRTRALHAIGDLSNFAIKLLGKVEGVTIISLGAPTTNEDTD